VNREAELAAWAVALFDKIVSPMFVVGNAKVSDGTQPPGMLNWSLY
jgi:hypothetical protein